MVKKSIDRKIGGWKDPAADKFLDSKDAVAFLLYNEHPGGEHYVAPKSHWPRVQRHFYEPPHSEQRFIG